MTHAMPHGTNAAVSGLEASIALEAVASSDVFSGSPKQGTLVLGGIGETEVGIWELRDGVVTDTEVDEFFVVLSGGATIEFFARDGSNADDSEVVETVTVKTGDVMRLVAGSRTKWIVPDHIRKVYIA